MENPEIKKIVDRIIELTSIEEPTTEQAEELNTLENKLTELTGGAKGTPESVQQFLNDLEELSDGD